MARLTLDLPDEVVRLLGDTPQAARQVAAAAIIAALIRQGRLPAEAAVEYGMVPSVAAKSADQPLAEVFRRFLERDDT